MHNFHLFTPSTIVILFDQSHGSINVRIFDSELLFTPSTTLEAALFLECHTCSFAETDGFWRHKGIQSYTRQRHRSRPNCSGRRSSPGRPAASSTSCKLPLCNMRLLCREKRLIYTSMSLLRRCAIEDDQECCRFRRF